MAITSDVLSTIQSAMLAAVGGSTTVVHDPDTWGNIYAQATGLPSVPGIFVMGTSAAPPLTLDQYFPMLAAYLQGVGSTNVTVVAPSGQVSVGGAPVYTPPGYNDPNLAYLYATPGGVPGGPATPPAPVYNTTASTSATTGGNVQGGVVSQTSSGSVITTHPTTNTGATTTVQGGGVTSQGNVDQSQIGSGFSIDWSNPLVEIAMGIGALMVLKMLLKR